MYVLDSTFTYVPASPRSRTFFHIKIITVLSTMASRLGHRHLPLGGLVRRAGSAAKTVFAFAGVLALGSAALDFQLEQERKEAALRHSSSDNNKNADDEDASSAAKAKKEHQRILVLPFYRMKIVEKKKANALSSLAPQLIDRLGSDADSAIQIEAHDLVDIIHSAAEDPDIVGLYGVFGHGGGFSAGGYGHVEEIRNAIRVFNESHRVHREPNLEYKALILPRNGDAKPTYAYADNFGDQKEYFLASAFTHIHLQPQGDLSLYGVGMSVPFIRSALDKYGVIAHVFKHGKFKNAANSLTETGFTRAHRENTTAIVRSINQSICESIVQSRSLPDSFNQNMWQRIFKYGSLTAVNAKELGLVDYTPKIDPLDAILQANENDEAMKEAKEKWGKDIDVGSLKGTKTISLQDYKSKLVKHKKYDERKWLWHEKLKFLAEKSSATTQLLSLFQYNAPHFNIDEDEYTTKKYKSEKEKIAVVHVTGSIMSPMAKKVTDTLRKIKKDDDIKAVVLRVDSSGGSVIASEAVYQECKDMPKPIVCSFSNMAASGGYYLSAHCDRIFALPTTITGSIGVFGVKFDATGLAKDYGVSFEHIGTGEFSAANSLFQPMSPKVEAAFKRKMNETYVSFKAIVASGRNLSLKEVEARAQGRVWTGREALDQSLVDELGGLDKAISYAKVHHTKTGNAEVEYWPKPPSVTSVVSKLMGGENDTDASGAYTMMYHDAMQQLWNQLADALYSTSFSVSASDQENARVCADMDNLARFIAGGPSSMSSPALFAALSETSRSPEPLLTIDGNEALKIALLNSTCTANNRHVPREVD